MSRSLRAACGAGLILLAAAGVRPAAAQSDFPNIPAWSYPGAWHPGVGSDTISQRPRTITMRFLRDPVAEARPDFAGYRIYRATNFADTTAMVLVRRFTRQFGDSLFAWHFPDIDASTPLAQRVATFIDPDSSGSFQKVKRPPNDPCRPACFDSMIVLVPPPGPHDGFRTWYSITYEARNTTDNDYLDLFVPDLANCANPGAPGTCPNLNHKAANVANDVWSPREASAEPDSHFFARAVEPTRGPTQNLARVSVVPNPYRAVEAWNAAGENELHFINLPAQAVIRIYTLAGDLVRELQHQDTVRDFERWDLRNGRGRDVSSGIYLYRVVSGSFFYQNHFIVIR
ncbi:MAG: hypothetical protein HY076_09425 [Candidatus Eisenbacteria bacterium]|uniref:T9SS type A sorting domain-containing protein n=1 Tax=Eiseniibacteriota bacterium TaxID=2212470 RepID=A0A9D6LD21_UNCEI|nr:hypothetical protein [Candidatus Eisenbacteria bacterium]MBI3540479.1 hypothetical protein [Candidatus Eisenbacteria bacterium]